LDNILVSSAPITPVVSIYDIQYTENVNGTSPLVDQTITTQGIVTATYSGGYFIQDDAGAWNGIEVFNSANSPQIGDELKITGKVVEFNGITQISFVSSYQVISSQNDLPEAPVVDNMTASSEAYESVLIRVEEVVCTSGLNGFGEWTIQDQSAAMTVDDKLFAYTPTQGTMYNVTGIGYFGFNVYRILPRFAADIEAVLNLSEEQLDNLSIFPNPAVNELTIQGAHGANYAIIDAQGKIISSDVLTNDTQTINITNLESGIYFINFEGVKTYKFVIK
jgi:hypothetical protein